MMRLSCESLVYLQKDYFAAKERTIVQNGDMTAGAFIFDTGVHALRLTNRRGEIIVLPYQGQQVWSCRFDGKELTMKSMLPQPYPTTDYLRTYGGFILHCGATAMGVPSAKDSHPLHGELPNAPYETAYLKIGEDDKGRYIGVGGQYHHIVAFNHNYLAEPFIKLYEDSAVLSASMAITNLKNTDMELMYMMHINFRPVDYGELVYSAKCNPDDVRVHINIPSHIKPSAGLEEFKNFLYALQKNPEMHHVLKPGLVFDPEVVFSINYLCDAEGKSYSMQIHPDGYADYVSHRPAELDHGIRWIARTRNEDALGLVLPGTAENGGYIAEKEKGNIKILQAGQKIIFHVKAGLLKPNEAETIRRKIKNILE
ncbi:DUF4432 family protein [Mahella sp.]|uniref:DUF4432 family protein n=1 Tax=Mahella sp. TaxID=2798721 RepID=UPI0025BDE5F0|nr:DUF4432 family protein [Mahella sp.]